MHLETATTASPTQKPSKRAEKKKRREQQRANAREATQEGAEACAGEKDAASELLADATPVAAAASTQEAAEPETDDVWVNLAALDETAERMFVVVASSVSAATAPYLAAARNGLFGEDEEVEAEADAEDADELADGSLAEPGSTVVAEQEQGSTLWGWALYARQKAAAGAGFLSSLVAEDQLEPETARASSPAHTPQG